MSGRPLRYGQGEVLGDHARRIRRLERVEEVWHDATLESPWSNVGDPFHPVQFSRSVLRQLRFRGAATGGGVGDVMFFLPELYWPSKDERYVISNGATPAVLEVLASNGSATPLS